MKRLSRLTVTENNFMRGLTEKTIREARTVRTITLVTLIYLPASFTSVSVRTYSTTHQTRMAENGSLRSMQVTNHHIDLPRHGIHPCDSWARSGKVNGKSGPGNVVLSGYYGPAYAAYIIGLVLVGPEESTKSERSDRY